MTIVASIIEMPGAFSFIADNGGDVTAAGADTAKLNVTADDFVVGWLAYTESTAGVRQDSLGSGYTALAPVNSGTTQLVGAYRSPSDSTYTGPTWTMTGTGAGYATTEFRLVPVANQTLYVSDTATAAEIIPAGMKIRSGSVSENMHPDAVSSSRKAATGSLQDRTAIATVASTFAIRSSSVRSAGLLADATVKVSVRSGGLQDRAISWTATVTSAARRGAVAEQIVSFESLAGRGVKSAATRDAVTGFETPVFRSIRSGSSMIGVIEYDYVAGAKSGGGAVFSHPTRDDGLAGDLFVGRKLTSGGVRTGEPIGDVASSLKRALGALISGATIGDLTPARKIVNGSLLSNAESLDAVTAIKRAGTSLSDLLSAAERLQLVKLAAASIRSSAVANDIAQVAKRISGSTAAFGSTYATATARKLTSNTARDGISFGGVFNTQKLASWAVVDSIFAEDILVKLSFHSGQIIDGLSVNTRGAGSKAIVAAVAESLDSLDLSQGRKASSFAISDILLGTVRSTGSKLTLGSTRASGLTYPAAPGLKRTAASIVDTLVAQEFLVNLISRGGSVVSGVTVGDRAPGSKFALRSLVDSISAADRVLIAKLGLSQLVDCLSVLDRETGLKLSAGNAARELMSGWGISAGLKRNIGRPLIEALTVQDRQLTAFLLSGSTNSSAAVDGSAVSFSVAALPVTAELLMQRRITHAFILTDPKYIVLHPYQDMQTPSGGTRAVAGTVRDGQVMRLIDANTPSSPSDTQTGEMRTTQYELLGEWDAGMAVGDRFTVQCDSGEWRIENIFYFNGYERRAEVLRYGR